MEHGAQEKAAAEALHSVLSQGIRREGDGGGTGQERADAKVSIRNLDFFYGEKQALHGINVDFQDRCVTALIGPSGCGKSTLLRVLNRVYELYPGQRATGEVLVDGKNILDPATDLRRLRTRVGMTFQTPNPFPKTIYENIAFGIRLNHHLSHAELDEAVEKALRGAALWDEVKGKLDRHAYSLSGGQQQRLCIARTIALDPEVLLFDEPCSALDPISTVSIETLLGELARRYCVVIITHNMEQARRISDFTAFMYLGKIIEYGPTEEIFVSPKDHLTNDYVTGRLAG